MSNFISVLCQIFVLSSAYVLGRFNFSFGWILPFFYSAFCGISSQRTPRTIIDPSINESLAIISRLGDNFPAWLLFPDIERAEWVNTIVKLLWPKINRQVEKILKEIEPKIAEIEFLQSFSFKKFDLGKISPRITGIKVYKTNIFLDEIIVDVFFSYIGDCEISFTNSGFDGGIKNCQLNGQVRVILSHLESLIPFVGDIEVYFLECPEFDYEFFSVLAVFDMFEVGDIVRAVIKRELTNRLVFPGRILVQLNSNLKVMNIPKVDGVIRACLDITLPAAEAYQRIEVDMQLGNESKKTEFSKEKPGKLTFDCDFVKFSSVESSLKVSVSATKEDAEAVEYLKTNVDVSNIKEIEALSEIFPLSPTGSATLTLSWLTLSSNKEDLKMEPSKNSRLLEIWIESVRNLSKSAGAVFVRLLIDNQSMESKTLDKTHSCKQHFSFFLSSSNSETLTVKIVEQLSMNELGETSYKISDLMARKQMKHDLQAFPLAKSADGLEICMSLQLSMLKAQ